MKIIRYLACGHEVPGGPRDRKFTAGYCPECARTKNQIMDLSTSTIKILEIPQSGKIKSIQIKTQVGPL